MSKSQTFRVIELTEAEASEIAGLARIERDRTIVVPELRARLLERAGDLGSHESAQLRDQLAACDNIDDLLAFPLPSADSNQLPERLPQPAALSKAAPSQQPVNADHLAAQLVALELEAERIGIDLDEAAVERIKSFIESPRLTPAHHAADALAVLDRQIDDAVIITETQQRARRLVESVLGDMGFDVTSSSPLEGVAAQTTDGRTACVVVKTGTDTVVDAEFDHRSDSVPANDPAATDICEPSVDDSVAFQKGLDDGSFTLGRVWTEERPSRGRRDQPLWSTRPNQTSTGERR